MMQPDMSAPCQSDRACTSTWVSTTLFTLVPLFLCGIGLVVVAGKVIGDISPFFQWLSWVPMVMLLPLLLIASLLSLKAVGSRARGLRGVCGGFLGLTLIWVGTVDFAFFRASAETEGDLVLVNWNATILPGEDSFQEALLHSNKALEVLDELDAEVLVIFNGAYLRLSTEWKEFQSGFAHSTRRSTVMVLSAHEILEVRPILTTDKSLILKIRIRHHGEERIIWGFDLPSSPRLSRSALFATLRAELDQVTWPEPDVLVGDFNVPRGSRSLGRAFPEFRNAFSEAGTGWSGTWPRALPLWDLDQVLVGSRLTAVRYETVTPPFGTHCIQRVVLRW